MTSLINPYLFGSIAQEVPLLLHMNGPNNSSYFVDNSVNNFCISQTSYQSNVLIKTAQSKFNGSSGLFAYNSTSPSYLQTPSSSTLNLLQIGFTLEAWIYPTSSGNEDGASGRGIISVGGGQPFGSGGHPHFYLTFASSNRIRLSWFSGDNSGITPYIYSFTSTGTVGLNAWSHVVAMKSGNTVYLAINGTVETLSGQVFGTPALTTPGALIGANSGYASTSYGDSFFLGYMAEVRVTKGARSAYMSNFTPPTTSFPDYETPASDPYFPDVSLLLPMEATATTNPFVDFSRNSLSITVYAAVISTAQKKTRCSSGFFDGTVDFLSVAYNSAIDLIGSDFTVEAWAYPTYYRSTNRFICAGGGAVAYNTTNGIHWAFQILSGGQLNFQIKTAATSSSSASVSTVGTVSLNTWSHLAVSVEGTTAYLSINGVVESFSLGALLRPSSNPTVEVASLPGENGSGFTAYSGYIDDLRITKGIARFKTNFTPSTSPLPLTGPAPGGLWTVTTSLTGGSGITDPLFSNVLLLMHFNGANNSTSMVDNSGTPKTMTANGDAKISTTQSKFGGSGVFLDGAGDSVTSGNVAALAFGTGDFTVECFVYATAPGVIMTSRAISTGSTIYWYFGHEGNRLVLASRTSGGTEYAARSAVGTLGLNQWHHVAGVRSGGVLTVFVDGVPGPTTANDGSNNLTETYVSIGLFNYPGFVGYYTGFIDEVRITKGIARYASAYTPPTAQFPDS